MIYKVHYYNLRNNELLQFLNDILVVCNQLSTEPMKLAAVIAALLTDTNAFDNLFKLNPKSPITQELIKLDFFRDNCTKGIRGMLISYGYHFDPAIKSAAETLLTSMDKYGKSIQTLNYPAQTSTINSLVDEWKNIPVLSGAVTLLALNTWVNELSSKNKLFNDKYISRANEKSTAPHVKTFDARVKAIESYKSLVDMIESGATFMGDHSFDGLINLINELIVKYNVIADSHAEDPEETSVTQ